MAISDEVRERVRAQAGDRCGYCRSLQKYVLGILEIDHLIPTAKGGTDDEDNLWLACRLCNSYKGTQTHGRDPVTGRRIRLFNPRHQKWSRHFTWSEDGTQIIGKTICGRATVVAFQLNNIIAVMVRREWVAAGWHPPKIE
ncbi:MULTISPECIES: HNH endonuclease [Cyanophyceae]|uniref:HNH endonuclease n=1 Tax=Cyanophyceae TaxID=3028117 RepID=UPI001687D5F9|nr:HNH endonuclease signature motif containing protein [Trichocoleus sp. FACHB-40]MBD2005524.1 HNH endonuclease [Trichocoleus sp. FACHB-40]